MKCLKITRNQLWPFVKDNQDFVVLSYFDDMASDAAWWELCSLENEKFSNLFSKMFESYVCHVFDNGVEIYMTNTNEAILFKLAHLTNPDT